MKWSQDLHILIFQKSCIWKLLNRFQSDWNTLLLSSVMLRVTLWGCSASFSLRLSQQCTYRAVRMKLSCCSCIHVQAHRGCSLFCICWLAALRARRVTKLSLISGPPCSNACKHTPPLNISSVFPHPLRLPRFCSFAFLFLNPSCFYRTYKVLFSLNFSLNRVRVCTPNVAPRQIESR